MKKNSAQDDSMPKPNLRACIAARVAQASRGSDKRTASAALCEQGEVFRKNDKWYCRVGIKANTFHDEDYLSKGVIMANEKLMSAIREVRNVGGKPIYLIKSFEPISDSTPKQYRMIAEVVRGYNTAMVWTHTIEVMLDEEFNILSLTSLAENSFYQNFYSGEGFGSPR